VVEEEGWVGADAAAWERACVRRWSAIESRVW
jgi:hypothetical protein